jgi:tetratricopeptide (TPR) repeat protein
VPEVKKLIISCTIIPVILLSVVSGISCGPTPAAFSVSNLIIEPLQVYPNETVTISVSVANTGGSQGSYNTVLNINGVQEETESVTMAAGDSKSVTFSVTREYAGSYTVTVDDLSGSFTVMQVQEVLTITGLSINEIVEELAYSKDTGNALTQMINNWLDERGDPIYGIWRDEITKAREDFNQGEISEQELGQMEIGIAGELSRRIETEISYRGVSHTYMTFDLDEIIERREANCLGYAQLFYILGNSLGLQVETLDVEDPGVLEAHVSCLINLTNGNVVIMVYIADISQEFGLEDTFSKVGNYWELLDKNNLLGFACTRFRILDRDGLIALRYYTQGNNVYAEIGQYDKAISEYNLAINLDPQCASAYQARGAAYSELGEYNKAIADYTQAIELNPRFAKAYHGRGITYGQLEEYDQVIADCTKAIEIDPNYALFYSTRAFAYIHLDEHDKALIDLNTAINLDPQCVDAYRNRGAIYALLGYWDEAIADLNKAKELDPALTEIVDNLLAQIEEWKTSE